MNKCATQQDVKQMDWGGDGEMVNKKKLCCISYSIDHFGAKRKSEYPDSTAYPGNRIVTLDGNTPIEIERKAQSSTHYFILNNGTDLSSLIGQQYNEEDLVQYVTTELLTGGHSYTYARYYVTELDGIVTNAGFIGTGSMWGNTLDGQVGGNLTVENLYESATFKVTLTGFTPSDENGIITYLGDSLPYVILKRTVASKEMIGYVYHAEMVSIDVSATTEPYVAIISCGGVFQTPQYRIIYSDGTVTTTQDASERTQVEQSFKQITVTMSGANDEAYYVRFHNDTVSFHYNDSGFNVNGYYLGLFGQGYRPGLPWSVNISKVQVSRIEYNN
jgi:hypothetical protein